MLPILNAVLPVFILVGAGYVAVRFRLFPEEGVSYIMRFAQNFGIPCLLFMALTRLDLHANFNAELMIGFYSGAVVSFILGCLAARNLFGKRPGESVAIGFGALFSNGVLLGVPIMERAYGTEALAPNFALISIHAPFCYLLGITTMEVTRADGRSAAATARVTLTAMFRNALTMACGAGLVVNLIGLHPPEPVAAAMNMIGRAALPIALFGLGGVLTRYRIRAALGPAATIALLATIVHPAIAYTLTHHVFDMDMRFVRSATVMAAMAPGVNAYLFASMYARAVGEAATAVLVATALSVFTAAGWLWALGGASIG